MQEHFRVLQFTLAWSGEILLYAYFAMPFIVDEKLSVISLRIPPQADAFGTVWPYYSLIHLAAFLIACGLFVLGSGRCILSNKFLLAYLAVNLIAVGAFPLATPAGQPMYWDYALEFVRLASLTFLATAVLEVRNYDPAILARCLLIVLAIPLSFLLISNPVHFLAQRSGRVNGPGLEITSTGHAGAIALLLGISLPLSQRYRIPMMVLGSTALILSGSRIPFALALLIATIHLWRQARSFSRRLAIVGTVAGLAGIAVALGSTGSVGGGRFGTLTGDSGALETEYTVGRGIALLTTMEMLSEHPLGYVDSDWAIQRELAELGFPSHTHSHYFQSYLRYGPLMALFWGVLIWFAVAGSRAGSPYAGCLWFIVIGSALDYYGFVTKAMVVVFMIAFLNEAYVRGASPGSNYAEVSLRAEKGAVCLP
jgi:hypothetical protein